MGGDRQLVADHATDISFCRQRPRKPTGSDDSKQWLQQDYLVPLGHLEQLSLFTDYSGEGAALELIGNEIGRETVDGV